MSFQAWQQWILGFQLKYLSSCSHSWQKIRLYQQMTRDEPNIVLSSLKKRVRWQGLLDAFLVASPVSQPNSFSLFCVNHSQTRKIFDDINQNMKQKIGCLQVHTMNEMSISLTNAINSTALNTSSWGAPLALVSTWKLNCYLNSLLAATQPIPHPLSDQSSHRNIKLNCLEEETDKGGRIILSLSWLAVMLLMLLRCSQPPLLTIHTAGLTQIKTAFRVSTQKISSRGLECKIGSPSDYPWSFSCREDCWTGRPAVPCFRTSLRTPCWWRTSAPESPPLCSNRAWRSGGMSFRISTWSSQFLAGILLKIKNTSLPV